MKRGIFVVGADVVVARRRVAAACVVVARRRVSDRWGVVLNPSVYVCVVGGSVYRIGRVCKSMYVPTRVVCAAHGGELAGDAASRASSLSDARTVPYRARAHRIVFVVRLPSSVVLRRRVSRASGTTRRDR